MPIQNITNVIQTQVEPVKSTPASSGQAVKQFSSFLIDALNEVNHQQQASSVATEKIATGDIQDLHKALILKQQAGITLDLTIEVRNKAVEAYQEMMRMSI